MTSNESAKTPVAVGKLSSAAIKKIQEPTISATVIGDGDENDSFHDDQEQRIEVQVSSDTATTMAVTTGAASNDNDVLGSWSSISTPTNAVTTVYSSELIKTPEDQPITTFESVGISPGSLKIKDLRVVETRIRQDGILCVLSPIPAEKQLVVRRCLVFLYAMGFFWESSKDERIANILRCIDWTSKSLNRLCKIAFSDASERLCFHGHAFELLVNVAETVRILLNSKNRKHRIGGFPRRPFVRIQASSNCYLVAAAVFCSLLYQKHFPESEKVGKPIDTAQIARCIIIVNDQALLDRVVHNKGACAYATAKKLMNSRGQDWVSVPFTQGLAEVRANIAWRWMEDAHFGLVTEFIVPKPFQETALNQPPTGIGYWLFDGPSADCEGQYVTLKPDKEHKQKRKDLYDEFTKHLQLALEKKGYREGLQPIVHDPSTTSFLAARAEQDMVAGGVNKNGDEEAVEQESGTHAMVVIGAFRAKRNPFHRRRTHYFILLNWWSGMPLVVVSEEYLRQSQCTILFFAGKLEENPELKRKEGLIADTAYPDAGENSEAVWEGFCDMMMAFEEG